MVSRAVLGLLVERPAYQYQLASMMEQRMGPGWSGLHGQVSLAIKALEDDELIRPVERPDEASGARTFYEITEAGISEFACFEKKDLAVRLPKRPIQVQLALAGKAQLQDVLERLEAYERNCASLMSEVMAFHRRNAERDDPLVLRADHLLLRLSLGADLAHLEAELDWAREAREVVTWLMTKDAVWPTDRSAERGQRARAELFRRLRGTSNTTPDESDGV